MDIRTARVTVQLNRGDAAALFSLKQQILNYSGIPVDPTRAELDSGKETARSIVEFLDGIVYLADRSVHDLSETHALESILQDLVRLLRLQSVSDSDATELAAIELAASVDVALIRQGQYASTIEEPLRDTIVSAADALLWRLIKSDDLDTALARWALRVAGDALDVCTKPVGRKLISLSHRSQIDVSRLSRLRPALKEDAAQPGALLHQAQQMSVVEGRAPDRLPKLYATDIDRLRAGRSVFSDRDGQFARTARGTALIALLLTSISAALIGLMLANRIKPWPFFSNGWPVGPAPAKPFELDFGLTPGDVVTGSTGMTAVVATICVAIAVSPRFEANTVGSFGSMAIWYEVAGGVARLSAAAALMFGALLFFAPAQGSSTIGPAVFSTVSGLLAVILAAAVSSWTDNSSQVVWSENRDSARAKLGTSDEAWRLNGRPRRGTARLVAFVTLPPLTYCMVLGLAVAITTPLPAGTSAVDTFWAIIYLAAILFLMFVVLVYPIGALALGAIVARSDRIRMQSMPLTAATLIVYGLLAGIIGGFLVVYSFAAGTEFADYARPWTFAAGMVILGQIIVASHAVIADRAEGSVALAIRFLALRRARRMLERTAA